MQQVCIGIPRANLIRHLPQSHSCTVVIQNPPRKFQVLRRFAHAVRSQFQATCHRLFPLITPFKKYLLYVGGHYSGTAMRDEGGLSEYERQRVARGGAYLDCM